MSAFLVWAAILWPICFLIGFVPTWEAVTVPDPLEGQT